MHSFHGLDVFWVLLDRHPNGFSQGFLLCTWQITLIEMCFPLALNFVLSLLFSPRRQGQEILLNEWGGGMLAYYRCVSNVGKSSTIGRMTIYCCNNADAEKLQTSAERRHGSEAIPYFERAKVRDTLNHSIRSVLVAYSPFQFNCCCISPSCSISRDRVTPHL